MFKKDQAKNYNKFYHNDIKKQLGIDQSRTASQKLLDKAIKVDKRPDFYSNHQQGTQNQGKPKKKVKTDPQNEKPQSNKEILENKLLKNIENQTNVSKLLKSLTILKKCLNQEAFINDPEIDLDKTWNAYSDKLINELKQRNYSSIESFNIMAAIADCLEILLKRFSISKPNKKSNQEGEICQVQSLARKTVKEQVSVWFCRLFTDDSFNFNKNLVQLKKFIFSQFHFESNAQTDRNLGLEMVQKLVTIPIKYDWAYTSLTNLLKQFNNEGYHNEFPNQDDKKAYLKSYNELLNRKPKSSGSTSSYNMMGNSKESAGVKTVHIESSLQSGSDKWVSKQ